MAWFDPNFPGATNNSLLLAGTKAAANKLGDTDVHFGRNGSISVTVPRPKGWINDSDACKWNELGPRSIDVVNRGGTVAEVLWAKWIANPKDTDVSGFVSFFDDFHKGLGTGKPNFPTSAPLYGEKGPEDLGNQIRYKVAKNKIHLTGKTPQGVAVNQFGRQIVQLGTRWSKVALEMARKTGHIHFHLDGLGDIQDMINKAGQSAYNVTTREFRYVYRHWKRGKDPFEGHVTFYNGFDDDKKTPLEVKCPPWN